MVTEAEERIVAVAKLAEKEENEESAAFDEELQDTEPAESDTEE
jgi:hypothetical protein